MPQPRRNRCVDRGGKLDLLHAIGVLVLFGFLLFLGLLVSVLAVVDHPADRRRRVGGDLDKVHGAAAGEIDRFVQGNDTHLLPVRTDDTNFAGTYLSIDPDEGTCRWRVTM